MIGQAWYFGRPHDVAHCARRAGTAGPSSHIAVRGDSTGRDAAQHTEYSLGEYGTGSHKVLQHRYRTITSVSACPCARGSLIPTSAANVGAKSAGLTSVG